MTEPEDDCPDDDEMDECEPDCDCGSEFPPDQECSVCHFVGCAACTESGDDVYPVLCSDCAEGMREEAEKADRAEEEKKLKRWQEGMRA